MKSVESIPIPIRFYSRSSKRSHVNKCGLEAQQRQERRPYLSL
eukprot:COSAG02_NODE_49448_length_326_cov_4.348018_1_plen_42_part_10